MSDDAEIRFGPYEVCEFFLATILAELDRCDADEITHAYPGIGVPVWDNVCGQLVVTPERVYRSSTFPTEDTTDERCEQGSIAVTVLAQLVRCVPTIDSQGRAPSQARLAEAHKRILDDAAIVWNAMSAPLPTAYEWERAYLRQTPVVPSGGAVAIETRATIGMEAWKWCGSC